MTLNFNSQRELPKIERLPSIKIFFSSNFSIQVDTDLWNNFAIHFVSNLQTISIESWRPEDGKGLFGKRVSAMASFLVLAKMASHRAKTSPLYHNEPPTSIEPLRGCSSSSSLHIKRMSYTKAKQPRSSCAAAFHSSKAFWHLMITSPPATFLLL